MNRRNIRRAALLVVIGSMVAAQPVVAQPNQPCAAVLATGLVTWPQFHSDLCHTGYNPNEFLLSPATVGNLALLWKYPTGAAVRSSPAVANGVVYVGSYYHDNVYALDATTGALLWTSTTGSSASSSPAVANGVVYRGGGDYNVYALNATTGALLWKYPTGSSFFSSPAVANGVVYVASSYNDNKLYALNATTGALLWKYSMGYYSSPAGAKGVVYVGSSYNDNKLYALNAATGALLWKYGTAGGVGFLAGGGQQSGVRRIQRW